MITFVLLHDLGEMVGYLPCGIFLPVILLAPLSFLWKLRGNFVYGQFKTVLSSSGPLLKVQPAVSESL